MTYDKWVEARSKSMDMFGGEGMPVDRATYEQEIVQGLTYKANNLLKLAIQHGYAVTLAGGQVVLEKFEAITETSEAAE